MSKFEKGEKGNQEGKDFGDALKVKIPCEDCGGNDYQMGCGMVGVDECRSCYGFGYYSCGGTEDNPFPRKDD